MSKRRLDGVSVLGSAAFVVLASSGLFACHEPHFPEGTEGSHFEAHVMRALALDLEGGGSFWCVQRPLRMCGLHLFPAGGEGDSLNFTVTGRASGEGVRPGPGTYAIEPELDPSGRALRANYLSTKRGNGQRFVAESGTFVVETSRPAELAGYFAFDGLGLVKVGGVNPKVHVEGRFSVGCELEPRAAYTCD